MPETTRQPRKTRKPARATRVAKQSRSKATVSTILQAATRILRKHGWAGFTTNAVAERAGVSIGSLYEYFKNKDAIIDAIRERHLSQAEKLIAAGVGMKISDPFLIAQLVVAGSVKLHSEDPRLHRVLADEVPMTPAAKRRCIGLLKMMSDVVAASLEGRVRDPALSAWLIAETADAMVHRWAMDAEGIPVDTDALAAELARMISAYLRDSMRAVRADSPMPRLQLLGEAAA